MTKNYVSQRAELLFLYDVKDNNPNGDPLNENKPRIDEETGENIITDVRLKRTIRDYLHNFESEEIFVREIELEDGSIPDAKLRARYFVKQIDSLNEEQNKIVKDFSEGKKLDPDKIKVIKDSIRLNLLQTAIDVRLFGATVPLEFAKSELQKGNGKKTSITLTGPVQFNIGRSMHKVAMKHIRGTGAFASKKGAEQKTFREEDVLHYSLIRFHGIINENAAQHTHLTNTDVDALLRGMWHGTKNLISRSKVGQQPRLLLKVNYGSENYHIGDLFSYVHFESEKDDLEIRGVQDGFLDVTSLVDLFKDKQDKIDSVQYEIDRLLKCKYKGESFDWKQIQEVSGVASESLVLE